MIHVRKTLVALAAGLMLPIAPAAVGAGPVRMQDFVTVQSQQSTTNYTDHYTLGTDGRVTLVKLAPIAASVTSADQGGELHMAASAMTRPGAWSAPSPPPAAHGAAGSG